MNDPNYEAKQANQATLNKRNTETVELKLKEMDATIREQEVRINQLNATMSTMYQRMDQLEQRLNMEKIMSMGTGPSVRG